MSPVHPAVTEPPPTPTTPGSRQSPRSKLKPNVTQKTAWAMQKHRFNKLATSDFAKQALKRLTMWYVREIKKPNDLSSYQIANCVKKE
jgi:hypothetical protein